MDARIYIVQMKAENTLFWGIIWYHMMYDVINELSHKPKSLKPSSRVVKYLPLKQSCSNSSNKINKQLFNISLFFFWLAGVKMVGKSHSFRLPVLMKT